MRYLLHKLWSYFRRQQGFEDSLCYYSFLSFMMIVASKLFGYMFQCVATKLIYIYKIICSFHNRNRELHLQNLRLFYLILYNIMCKFLNSHYSFSIWKFPMLVDFATVGWMIFSNSWHHHLSGNITPNKFVTIFIWYKLCINLQNKNKTCINITLVLIQYLCKWEIVL
jgi:hypothetical protein